MKTEFEIAFLKIDREKLRENLKSLGAVCIMENILMKRVVFDNPTKNKSYVRVRDEGDKITCTYKEISDGKLDINSVKELEVQIDDYETMVNIFRNLGLKQKAYQETYRETWSIDNKVYFMLDEWPGLNPFIEIEGESENIVRDYSQKLGFDYDKGLFGAVDEIYLAELLLPREYINNLEIITFDNPPKI